MSDHVRNNTVIWLILEVDNQGLFASFILSKKHLFVLENIDVLIFI